MVSPRLPLATSASATIGTSPKWRAFLLQVFAAAVGSDQQRRNASRNSATADRFSLCAWIAIANHAIIVSSGRAKNSRGWTP